MCELCKKMDGMDLSDRIELLNRAHGIVMSTMEESKKVAERNGMTEVDLDNVDPMSPLASQLVEAMMSSMKQHGALPEVMHYLSIASREYSKLAKVSAVLMVMEHSPAAPPFPGGADPNLN